jgi:acyl dehydratase
MARPIPRLRYEDLSQGDQAPVLVHELTRADLIAYAGASGDMNPMHTDQVAAVAAGLPGVFGHGMLSMGILARALTDWAGVGNLLEYRARFTKQTWPGETLSTRVVVTGKSQSGDARRVTVDVALANQDGELKLAGSAVVAAA